MASCECGRISNPVGCGFSQPSPNSHTFLVEVEYRWKGHWRPDLGQDDAETIIEAVAVLHRNGLREATCGDSEAVEEADVAEQDQAEAVPAIDEPH